MALLCPGMSAQTHAGRVTVEHGTKRVRTYAAGELVADTTRPLLVWEGPHYPTYYFPVADVRASLTPTGDTEHSPSRGDASVFDVETRAGIVPKAARRYLSSPLEELRDHVRFDWDRMDEWLEEDEPVYVHARNPYTRVDILNSSRHVEVRVGGVVVADSRQPRILFETGLMPRYYLPMSDVRLDLLTPTATTTQCPYKGTATYWSVGDHADVAWCYRTPLPESQKIGGLVCFYQERVEVLVDGESAVTLR